MTETKDKIKYMEFLGSKAFFDYLEEMNLPAQMHNKILAVHMLAIAVQSSGISDGSIYLNYIKILDDTDANLTAKTIYAFYTTKNGLIENTLHSTRSSIKIKNINFPHFKDPRTFKEFFNSYWSHMKPLPTKKIKEAPANWQLTIRQGKKNKSNLYDDLIENVPEVKSFISYHFISKNLPPKESTIKDLKNKI